MVSFGDWSPQTNQNSLLYQKVPSKQDFNPVLVNVQYVLVNNVKTTFYCSKYVIQVSNFKSHLRNIMRKTRMVARFTRVISNVPLFSENNEARGWTEELRNNRVFASGFRACSRVFLEFSRNHHLVSYFSERMFSTLSVPKLKFILVINRSYNNWCMCFIRVSRFITVYLNINIKIKS